MAMQTTGGWKLHPVPHIEEYTVTRKGALNVLTEVVERASAGSISAAHRMKISEALRKLTRMVYDKSAGTVYPIRVAEEITPSESELDAESRE